MSQHYAITSLDEARAYLAHHVLGTRLCEITKALLQHKDKSSEQILGYIDAVKVRSSMTLFDILRPNSIFSEVLDVFYDGKPDDRTLQLLKQ